MTLMQRRRALMGAQGGESFPLYLYNNGVTSGIIGGWNTTGYKYNPETDRFNQSENTTALCIYATNQYNIKGGRTYTGNNPIPSKYIGKTLHVKGYWELNGDLRGTNYNVYAFVSDAVQDAASTENVLSSGAFTNEIHAVSTITQNMSAGSTKTFEMQLPLTKAGYLSLVMYKGYSGLIYSYFQEVWIE